ncbi:glycosyltransferase [Oleispirillum naphthae]|uniref:glycosyltransferase n=1 Tax=Oleispirillum naphthae TaxID=2838853 RepID=UPI00308235D5
MTADRSISIVIPCYDSGATLPQTLDSLRAQSLPPREIIVVDDGSTDPATVALLDSLSDIRLVRQPNRGLPAARNAGFAAATGELVLPLDADDWLEPDALEKLAAALAAHPEAAFAFSHIRLEGESRGVLKKHYNFFEQLFLNQMPYCVLIRRAEWVAVGGYDETMRRGYEDWEFNIRLGARGRFGVVAPEPLFHYRVTSGGMLLSKSRHLHGSLWTEVQARNPEAYTWGALWALWRTWRRQPSTYPLSPFFAWLALHRALPDAAFQALFRLLVRFSHGRRVTQHTPGRDGA